ncbi:MAG: STAS domain-containing protein, partial [Chitinivibrionales bacterium]|nr:STAS domain-containing protein [Chitinivibrionales bacterium]MBD3356028.1 STAS domain-containing protein [Chitinivibrionales bacterium]
PRTYVVVVEGPVDLSTQTHLSDALDRLRVQGAQLVGLGLQKVNYMSSAGWGLLAATLKELRREGGDLVLLSMNNELEKTFRLLQFHKVFQMVSSEKALRAHAKKLDKGRLTQQTHESAKTGPASAGGESVAGKVAVPLEEAIAGAIADYGPVSIPTLKRLLNEKGYKKVGYLHLYRTLKTMDLDSQAKRLRFYRSC